MNHNENASSVSTPASSGAAQEPKTEQVELKPCPHCGSPAESEDGGFNYERVTCSNYNGCVKGKRVYNTDPQRRIKLIENWNRREPQILSDASGTGSSVSLKEKAARFIARDTFLD